MKSCCVTGHRNIAEHKIDYVTNELRREIEEAIQEGFTFFFSGFASGADMIFAKLVLEQQKQNPDIQLEGALPYPTWFVKRSKEDKEILSRCNIVGVHSKKYTQNCFLIRNRVMVAACERVIAVYDGREKGGTVNTMRYAAALEKDVRVIKV